MGRIRALLWSSTFFFWLFSVPPSLASTVGTLSGRVIDQARHSPVAGVTVTAVSPSGRYSAKTNGAGFYSITGVSAGTYTVSFQIGGYEPQTVADVNIFADQVATVNAAMAKSLKTIALVRTRNPGGAFQPNSPFDTYTVNSTQINNINGNPFNLSEGYLLRALPEVTYSIGQAPSIRGGRTDMVDYEFEGIPYTDPYLNKYINDLMFPGFGIQSVELIPGVQDASFGDSGDGSVNVIARQGQYPGSLEIGGVAGGPGFFHGINAGYGVAAPNGRWSEYASFTGQDSAPRYGGPYWTLGAGEIGISGGIAYTADREFTNNFVYNFGRNNEFGVQYFVDTSYHRAAGGYGQDWQSECYATSIDPTCNGAVSYFTAATGFSTGQYQELLGFQPGQTSAQALLGQDGRPPYQEFYNGTGSKLQFNWHLNSSTYAFINYYNALGVNIADQVCCGPAESIYRDQGGWTNGVNLGITKQLSEKHLLKLGGDYVRLVPHNEGDFNTDQFFNIAPFGDVGWEIYDFLPPSDPNCPLGPGGCGHIYQYFPNASLITVPNGGAAAVLTSNGGGGYINDSWSPNARLRVEGGVRVDSMAYNLPPQGVLTDCTTRYAPVAVQTPNPTTGLLNGKPVGPGNCPQMLFNPITSAQSNPNITQPRIALAYQMGSNDAVRAGFGRSVRFIHGQEMDYTAPPDYGSEFAGIPAWYNPAVWNSSLFNGCKGVPNCQAPAAYQGAAYEKTPVECGYVAFNAAVPCVSYQEQLYWAEINDDFAFPITPLKPVTANNYDFSYEHQFAGGWGIRISPWSRRTYDLDVLQELPNENLLGQLVVNAVGQVSYRSSQLITNNGLEEAHGIGFYLTKSSLSGFSGQLALESQDVEQNVFPTQSDEYHGYISPITAAFPMQTYRVPYVSPFTGSLAFAYTTKSGWRFQTTLFYDVGYPYGNGLYAPYQAGSNPPAILPRTNVNGGLTQFIDPSNPGSFYHPNIVATLGTPESTFPYGLLTHSDLNQAITIEKRMGATTIGFSIQNLYNEAYPGPTYSQQTFGNNGPYGLTSGSPLYTFPSFFINPTWQPVATGVGGPLTGSNKFCTNPAACNATGNGAYVHYPNQPGINWYVYITTRL